MTAWKELRAWSKTLTDEQLSAVLEEMRDRGAAVAYYDVHEILAMFDGCDFAQRPEDWLPDYRAEVEETMCEAAREMFNRELAPSQCGASREDDEED